MTEKLELWSSNPRADECDVTVEQFEYLGFITLSDNQSTGFKSRELKSVTVPSCTAKYLKLRLHENHKNSLNVYNQQTYSCKNVTSYLNPRALSAGSPRLTAAQGDFIASAIIRAKPTQWMPFVDEYSANFYG
uniref:Centrosomal protein CEP104 N-terminal domain-containing protein n=1 Tax=Timema shepardi TaxID=629360 RepID=A0A7R9FW99_TIMSH|nr:unnamed protein product [Timema shepardi]